MSQLANGHFAIQHKKNFSFIDVKFAGASVNSISTQTQFSSIQSSSSSWLVISQMFFDLITFWIMVFHLYFISLMSLLSSTRIYIFLMYYMLRYTLVNVPNHNRRMMKQCCMCSWIYPTKTQFLTCHWTTRIEEECVSIYRTGHLS